MTRDPTLEQRLGNPWRPSAWMAFAVLVIFAFTMGGAIGAYPSGYAFWSNFWCDALQNPANGLPNPRGARLAAMSLWVLGSGLLPFWSMLAELAAPRAQAANSLARAAIAGLGICSMLAMMLVALLPSNEFRFLHGLMVTIAAPCGALAMLIAIAKGWSSQLLPPLVSRLGALSLLFGFLNFAQYERQFWLASEPVAWLAALQKLATFLFVAWVTATSAAAFAGAKRD